LRGINNADNRSADPTRFSYVKNQCGSPRINAVSWGRLEIEERTGTNHQPGIQPADLQELLDHGARVVVLSRGMKNCLQVPRETLDFLKARQIPAHVLPTVDAVNLYNELAEKEAVGGLFHTTC
jgi:hypothetical protein